MKITTKFHVGDKVKLPSNREDIIYSIQITINHEIKYEVINGGNDILYKASDLRLLSRGETRHLSDC
jgi:hypothetical protein